MGHRRRSVTIAGALTLLLALSGMSVAASAPGDAVAKKGKRADLIAKQVTATIAGRTAQAVATVTNRAGKKAGKKAKPSQLAFVLSTDQTVSTDDLGLGSVAVGRLKPKRSKDASGTFTIPANVPAGTYYVVACADSTGTVREKREQNNCSASGPVTIAPTPPPPPAPVTVSFATAPAGPGLVTATQTGGQCTQDPATSAGSCTVPSGSGTVTLTSPSPFVSFQAGPTGPCDGVLSNGGTTMTFTAPTAAKSCRIVFLV